MTPFLMSLFMLIEELTNAGITEEEAKAYLAILELGEGTISQIAKKSEIKRTSAYLVVERLIKKGLVSTSKVKKHTIYIAENPKRIEDFLEERKRSIQRIMPELLSFTNLIDKKPKIRYYEGRQGIKEIYKDMLRYPDSEILGMFSESYLGHLDDEFVKNYFYPQRVEKKIWVRAILPENDQTREIIKGDEKILRKSKLISNEKFKIKTDIDIYGKNKISLVSFEEQLGIIIESEKIFESLKGIFETIWDLIPERRFDQKIAKNEPDD